MNITDLINEGTFPRTYRKNTTPASINPAIAYAMIQLGGLEEKDRILDPCCGTGTILIERQLLKNAKPAICVGVDIDPRQLEMARENIELAAPNFPNSPPPGDSTTLIIPIPTSFLFMETSPKKNSPKATSPK